MKIFDFPKSDLPPRDFKRADLKNRQSKEYYYGIGVPVDYQEARYLAFKEMEDSNSEMIGGAAILIMIYANGYGVKRDLDISIRLACANIWSAPAEKDGRFAHLESMKDSITAPFDICDDITSGLMQGICTSIGTDMASAYRTSKIDSIIQKWSQRDTAAYFKVREAASQFFKLRMQNEVDLSGTARAAFELEEEDSLEELFYTQIVSASSCSFPLFSRLDYISADSLLNAVYKQVMDRSEAETQYQWGTVTKDGIKLVERKWILYRDAWVHFMKVRCPDITEASIKTLFTLQRVSQLSRFLPEKPIEKSPANQLSNPLNLPQNSKQTLPTGKPKATEKDNN